MVSTLDGFTLVYVQDAIFAWVGLVSVELWPFDFAKNVSKAKLMVYLQKMCTLA